MCKLRENLNRNKIIYVFEKKNAYETKSLYHWSLIKEKFIKFTYQKNC